MKQEQVVHLRVYKGKTLTYNEKGQSTNENHIVHLAHDTAEWKKYLSHLRANGIIKATVEKVLDLKKINEGKSKEDADYYQEVKDFKSIQAEVDKELKPESVKELTPEQKQIAELTARIDALTKGATLTVAGSDEEDEEGLDDVDELKAARKEYEEVTGKKGGPKWTVEEIRTKIEEFKAAN